MAGAGMGNEEGNDGEEGAWVALVVLVEIAEESEGAAEMADDGAALAAPERSGWRLVSPPIDWSCAAGLSFARLSSQRCRRGAK
ncbi:hypothetical protein GCM10011572_20980 [Pseudoduganella buxea]|uniref:Uncharacterized protein n=1 Tax=Pseudoduganella buxea TaxID=1949069 RepID=A0ABQ1KFT2_9BURK|nr:hypothetical protein GCM10011572_20980 [Pseudoduganella buxea]